MPGTWGERTQVDPRLLQLSARRGRACCTLGSALCIERWPRGDAFRLCACTVPSPAPHRGCRAYRMHAGAQLVEELQPEPGEVVLVKKRWSAFFATPLDLILRWARLICLARSLLPAPHCCPTACLAPRFTAREGALKTWSAHSLGTWSAHSLGITSSRHHSWARACAFEMSQAAGGGTGGAVRGADSQLHPGHGL